MKKPKSVITKVHAPTGINGHDRSRISATDDHGNKVYIPYPYQDVSLEEKHYMAVRELNDRLGWTGHLVFVTAWINSTTRIWVETDDAIKYTIETWRPMEVVAD